MKFHLINAVAVAAALLFAASAGAEGTVYAVDFVQRFIERI